MVFSDTGDLHGGFYDNNSGVDYHVPIRGSTVRQPPLRIAHVSVEMAPIAKVHKSSVVSSLSCELFCAMLSSVSLENCTWFVYS